MTIYDHLQFYYAQWMFSKYSLQPNWIEIGFAWFHLKYSEDRVSAKLQHFHSLKKACS